MATTGYLATKTLPQGLARPCARQALMATRAQQQPHKSGEAGSSSCGGGTASRRRLLAALPPCACAVCATGPASAAAQRDKRNDALDQLFAASMATGMAEYEESIAPLKRLLFAQLLSSLPGAQQAAEGGGPPAQLLELGVGTGPNLGIYSSFYGLLPPQPSSGSGSNGGVGGSRSDSGSMGSSSWQGSGSGSGNAEGLLSSAAASASPAAAAATAAGVAAPAPAQQQQALLLPPVHITGVDPNPFMRPYLQQSLAASGWPAERFTWVQGRAEALPLGDASLDAVVCTLVLCSVEEVAPVLDEVARVLRPGGALLFIEHTTARLQAQPLLWLGQRALEPLQRALADNCHLTRDPLPALEAHPAFAGGVQAQRFSVDGASLIAPHVAGIAVRQPAPRGQGQQLEGSGSGCGSGGSDPTAAAA